MTFHSKYGAIQESKHVFIGAGLKPLLSNNIELSIFEMGFGTGLNALLTFIETEPRMIKVNYEAVETHPLDFSIVKELNYTKVLKRPELQNAFLQLHESPWNSLKDISERFYLYKKQGNIKDILFTSSFHLIYFDAFAPEVQPELWTADVFRKLYNALLDGGILVTYCSKVVVRRAMEEAGFQVEKIPGPMGKREIVRAWKSYSNV